jgi:hypothetical protein
MAVQGISSHQRFHGLPIFQQDQRLRANCRKIRLPRFSGFYDPLFVASALKPSGAIGGMGTD